MGTINRSFAKTFKEQILQNKMLLVITAFVAVLSFGFTFCNFSIGVDDPAAYHYLYTSEHGSMVQQGRLLHVLLEVITGSVDFIPFFNDFFGVSLFLLSSWVLCAVFQYITNNAFSKVSLAIFSGVYVSFPIIHEKFIFSLDIIPVMISYLCFAFSLLYSYQFIFEKRKTALIYAIIHLIFSVSSYESFIFLYIAGVCFLFLLETVVNKNKIKFGSFLIKGLIFAGILVAAVVVYYLIVVVVQLATNQYGIFVRQSSLPENASIFGIIYEMVISPMFGILSTLTDVAYVPFLIFDIFAVICVVFGIVSSVIKKDMIPFICSFGLLISNFGIFLIAGYLMQRAAQGFSFFVAGILLLVVYFIDLTDRVLLKKFVYAISALLIFVQSANLTLFFYNDYIRYKKEEFAIHSIAAKLVAECDIDKPIAIVGDVPWSDVEKGYLSSYNEDFQMNGLSVICQTMATWEDPNSQMYPLLEMHGYDFIKAPTEEQTKECTEKAKDMKAWPHKDSIKEFEDYIVVNFGNSGDEE